MNEGKEVQLVIFKLGDKHFAIELTKVREVVNASNIVRVPQTHTAIEGVMSLRGKIIPLIDLSNYLEVAGRDRNKILIYSANDGHKEIGFLVDHVVGVMRIKKSDLKIPEVGRISPIVKGFLELENELVPLIDLDAIAKNVMALLGDDHG